MEPISETNDTLISPQTPTPTERRPFNVTADIAAAWTTERLEQQLADYEERIAVMGDKINDHLDEGGRIEDSWYIRTRDARNHLRRQVRTIKVEIRNRGRSQSKVLSPEAIRALLYGVAVSVLDQSAIDYIHTQAQARYPDVFATAEGPVNGKGT